MKKFFIISLLLSLALPMVATAPLGSFLATLENGNVKKTVWLKLYDDPSSPYIGQFNTRPYRSFTLQFRVEQKNVGGFNDCKADVIVFYKATGYVSRSNSAQSFYLRTMHLDRKVESICLHGGFIEDQQKMRDAILDLDNGFYKNYQESVQGEQRYDFINFWKDGFSVGMSPFTNGQIVFKATKSTGIANKTEASAKNVKITSFKHDPLTIPDDSLYNPQKNNMERWCGRWEGVSEKSKYVFELYSDFTMGLKQKVKETKGEYTISFTLETEGEWEVKNGTLILHYAKDKKHLTLNESECSNLSESIKKASIEYLYNNFVNELEEARFEILGNSQSCLKIRHGATEFYAYRDRLDSYTPHLYPKVLPNGSTFKKDDYYKRSPQGMVRGTVFKANGDRIIGLFKKNLSLYPVLAAVYNSNKEKVSTIDELGDFADKDKEILNNNLLADDFLTPESGNSRYVYASGVVYEGDWLNHYPNGKGKKSYPNGAYSEGNWEDGGFRGGKGKLIYSTGEVYEGDLSASGYPQGIGRLDYDKGIYVGKFERGYFVNNEGLLTMKNGTTYKGEWNGIDGRSIFGKGVMTFPDSTILKGVWKMEGLESGNITFSNGSSYEGTFADNLFKQGVLRCGSYTFNGIFSKGYFQSGKLDYSDGGSFEGIWNNGQLAEASNISVIFQDQLVFSFSGRYKSTDKITGDIKLTNGYTISSSWNQGVMDSVATVVFSNGDKILASWTNNNLTPQSEFVYVWSDGLKCKAVVNKNGKLTKKEFSREGIDKIPRKEIKEHEMLFTYDDSFDIPQINVKLISEFITRKLSIPGVPQW